MMTSKILKSVVLQKHKNLDISRTKHYFFLKLKNSLITLQGLLYYKKNSFAAEVTLNSFMLIEEGSNERF